LRSTSGICYLFAGRSSRREFCRNCRPDRRIPSFAGFLVVAVCSLLIPRPARAQSPYSLNAGVLIPSGNGQPALVTSGDFNNDGKLDVITVESASGLQAGVAVAVYLGNGDGTFQSPTVTTISTTAVGRSLVIGDFNGDGKLDAAVASDVSPTGILTILLGKGDGTFSQSASYMVNGSVNSFDIPTMAVGDFNGDGKLDVVSTVSCYNPTVTSCAGAVLVYPGNGDGTFGTPQVYAATGNEAIPVTVADLNGDGKPDIVAVNPFPPGLMVLLNSGGGSFSQSTLPMSFYASNVVAADFNGDGKPDLALTGYYSQTQILFGNGDGTFQTPVQYPTSLNMGLAVADFNGDGKPDLVVGASASGLPNVADILINDGTGNFQVNEYPLGGTVPASVTTGDFNGDGKADVILASFCSVGGGLLPNHCLDGTLGLLLGNGDGTMQAATMVPSGPGQVQQYAVFLADLNGDGIPDLIEIGQPISGVNGAVTVSLGMGGGAFGPPTSISTGAAQPRSAVVGDFNHDGKADLAIAHLCVDQPCTTESVVVLLGNGNGTFQAPVIYPITTSPDYYPWIAAGDVNGDGNTDLVAVSQCSDSSCNAGAVSVLMGAGDGTFHAAVTTDTPNDRALNVAVADLNHDGKDEVVVLGLSTTLDSAGDYPALESIFGVNPDGTLNQIGQTHSAGGYGFSSSEFLSLTIGDINNDGNPDIVLANFCAHAGCDDASPPFNYSGLGGGGVGVLLGNGDGTFTDGSFYDIPDANFLSASLGDVTGDGKLDLIAATPTGLAVLPGNGDGTFGAATVFAGNSQGSALQVAVADLNGDGSLDVAVPGSYFYGPTAALYFNHAGLPGPASAPTNLTAKAVSPAEIDLSWNESSANITEFGIEDSSDGVNFSPLAIVGKGTTTFAMTGNNPGVQWFFRVRAENAEGYTLYSNVASATTPLLYTTSTTLTASPNPVATGQSVTLTATVTGGNSPGGVVTFMDGATQLGGSYNLVGNQATYAVSSLTPGVHHLSATYDGDPYNASSTGVLDLTVTQGIGTCANPNPNPNPNPASFANPGDFNGDCKSDILWRNSTSEQVYTWLMDGGSIAGQGPASNPPSVWVIQGAGDFDGDGKSDILWRNTSTGEVYLWLMNGTSIASQGSPGTVSSDWVIQGVGDFNGDGKADILWRNSTSGLVYLWLMNGTAIAGQGSVMTATSDWTIQSVGDFNGDGQADILWRNSTSGQVYLWLMNGTSIASQGSPATVSADWVIQGVGDFDGDGKTDILWRNSTSGMVYAWLMNGTSIASQASLGVVSSDWVIKGAGDYNGDGQADILWRNSTSGLVYLWLMNGTSIASQASVSAVSPDWQIAPTYP
jgi:hypothetical protein